MDLNVSVRAPGKERKIDLFVSLSCRELKGFPTRGGSLNVKEFCRIRGRRNGGGNQENTESRTVYCHREGR